jgi:hypothetical protein
MTSALVDVHRNLNFNIRSTISYYKVLEETESKKVLIQSISHKCITFFFLLYSHQDWLNTTCGYYVQAVASRTCGSHASTHCSEDHERVVHICTYHTFKRFYLTIYVSYTPMYMRLVLKDVLHILLHQAGGTTRILECSLMGIDR